MPVPEAHEDAGALASPAQDAPLPHQETACTKPDVEVSPPPTVKVLGSAATVQLFFSVPQLRGRDASVLERQLGAVAKEIFITRDREWKECQIPSPLGLTCPPWKIDTECDLGESTKVFSMVCINRLTDSPLVRPSVDYRAVNAIRCGNRLRILLRRAKVRLHVLREKSTAAIEAAYR
jgi:hypothetical protein